MKHPAIVALILAFSVQAAVEKIYVSDNDRVVMEAENTESPLGQWVFQTDIEDFTGSGHLEFTGNNVMTGPPNSPLKYNFKVDRSGLYLLVVRMGRDITGITPVPENDQGNDIFVKMSGKLGENTTSLLYSDAKLFFHTNGNNKVWTWSKNLDQNHNFYFPKADLTAGDVYTLTVAGRSKTVNIDRIIFARQDPYSGSSAKNSNWPESAFVYGDVNNGGTPPNPATPDWLTIPAGRLAFSHDGNEHDPDDWVAAAMDGALLWSAAAEDRVVHIDHSNHLIDSEAVMETEIQASMDGIVQRFGINPNIIFNDLTDLQAAIDNFKAEALASSSGDPLWYICAGPMEVPWRMLNAVKQADSSKLQYIHCVSHSSWNENHLHSTVMTHDWVDMKADFPQVTFHDIADQNYSDGDNDWSTPESEWDWLQNHQYEPFRWIYTRDEAFDEYGVLYRDQATADRFAAKFDCSDAGITYWWLSGGPDGGDDHAGWPEAQTLFDHALNSSGSTEPPIAPDSLNATALSISSIILNWTDNADNESGFDVQIRTTGGTFSTVSTEAANANSAIITGLNPGTTYEFRVSAINSSGSSEWSNTAAAATLALGQEGMVSGTVIGTDEHYDNLSKENVFDGDITTFFDSSVGTGAWAGYDFGANNETIITTICFYPRSNRPDRMVGGKFQGANSADFNDAVDLYIVENQPPVDWSEVTVTNTTLFRYVRYIGGNNSYGNIAEVQFLGVNLIPLSGKLSGAIIGTDENFSGHPKEDALDGDTVTFFDSSVGTGAWVGYDFGDGNEKNITRIRFYPRENRPDRMVGGKFQGANSVDFSDATDLFTISSEPPVAYTEVQISNGARFRYVRYLAGGSSYGNIAEMEFYGRSAAPLFDVVTNPL